MDKAMRAFLFLVATANSAVAAPTISDVLQARRAMTSELAPIQLRWVEQVTLTAVGRVSLLPTPKVDPSSNSGANATYEAILSTTHSRISRFFSDTGVGRDASWSPEAIYIGVPPIKGGKDVAMSPSLMITKSPYEEQVKYFDRLGLRVVFPLADHAAEDLLSAYIKEGFEVSAVLEDSDTVVVEGKGKLDPYSLGDGQTLVNHRFEFSPKYAWGLIRHQTKTLDGALIRSRENSGFERVDERNLYLPDQTVESYYVGKGKGLLDVATITHKSKRTSIDTGPFDNALFKVWYDEPGVFIQDDTGDEMVQYFTPPNPGDLEEVINVARGGKPSGISPLRLALIGINIVLVIILSVVAFKRLKRAGS